MQRREFLKLSAVGLAANSVNPQVLLARQARADFRNLKITAIDVAPLKSGSIFVLVRTSEGITGLGECSPMNARVIVPMLKESLVPIVMGKNPLDIDRLWEEMYHRTYKLGVMGAQPEAISGIDIALWDILGKVTNLPLWQLMGGKRKDRLRMYSSIGGGATAPVKDQVDKAIESVQSGFTALKMRMDWSSRRVDVDPRKDWEIVSTVRKEVGDKIDLCYDANNGLSVSTAIRLGRRFQDELNVVHFEEPIAQHDYAGYAEVCAALDMPVAAGEHEYTRWQFRDLIQQAKVDILQPDLVKCCGLSEGIRIAHLAQTHGKMLVPHQTQPTIGNTANLHFLACFDNSSRAQEYNYNPANSKQLWGLFKQDYSPKNGHITVPDGPGLGLEIDEGSMKAMATGQ
jgi:L-alanine-DL-glutamate epimerase-like enolase superfamily enzyme